jgi:hypothetical protein
MPWLSPSLFQQKNKDTVSERDIIGALLPFLCGNSDIPNGQNVLFDGLQAMIDGDLPVVQPAFYDGALPANIDKRVKDELGHFIIPSAVNSHLPAVPNFFMEVKAPNEDPDVAKRKACYYGALGARAMHKLQTYKEHPFYDNEAYTITSIYDPATGILELYVTHPTQPISPSTSPEYHMTQIGSYVLTDGLDKYRRGLTAFRNARDFAKEKRDRFIEEANVKSRALDIDK